MVVVANRLFTFKQTGLDGLIKRSFCPRPSEKKPAKATSKVKLLAFKLNRVHRLQLKLVR